MPRYTLSDLEAHSGLGEPVHEHGCPECDYLGSGVVPYVADHCYRRVDCYRCDRSGYLEVVARAGAAADAVTVVRVQDVLAQGDLLLDPGIVLGLHLLLQAVGAVAWDQHTREYLGEDHEPVLDLGIPVWRQELIAELRELGISQDDIALEAGIDQGDVSRVINGIKGLRGHCRAVSVAMRTLSGGRISVDGDRLAGNASRRRNRGLQMPLARRLSPAALRHWDDRIEIDAEWEVEE